MALIPGTSDRAAAADPVRTRLAAAGAAAVIVGVGLGLRAVAAGSVAKYGGDALYTALLLALVVVAAPRVTPLRAAASALTMSWVIEFFQVSGVPAELAQRSTVARLVLGSTFNPPDLFWYAVGAAAGWLIHATVTTRHGRGSGSSSRHATGHPTPSATSARRRGTADPARAPHDEQHQNLS